jgi:hypothetical protein
MVMRSTNRWAYIISATRTMKCMGKSSRFVVNDLQADLEPTASLHKFMPPTPGLTHFMEWKYKNSLACTDGVSVVRCRLMIQLLLWTYPQRPPVHPHMDGHPSRRTSHTHQASMRTATSDTCPAWEDSYSLAANRNVMGEALVVGKSSRATTTELMHHHTRATCFGAKYRLRA